MIVRTLRELRAAQPSRDGDGVAIQRMTGMRHAGMDPILMLDELRSAHREDFAGGFPPHPHRGMQTLTYLKHGGIIHEDNRGNRGEIRGGGAQWMSAGRGIIHSEMPTLDSSGLHGFQLWVNLPAAQKMSPPRYRDIPASALTTLEHPTVTATAIAGRWTLRDLSQDREETLAGPLQELADLAGVMDVTLAPHSELAVATRPTENVLVYIYDGSVALGEAQVSAQHMAITDAGDTLHLTAGADGSGLLVLRGEPLGEPVAHYGPFVMNTAEEIDQAIADYQSGRFG